MHIAQLNLARLRYPLDSPEVKEFVDAVPEINALADRSPGFVWRLTTPDTGDALNVRDFGDDVIANLTVWETVQALRDYVYRTPHLDYMRRRREWFAHDGLGASLVLWRVPVGHIPTLDEARQRREHLIEHGPTPHAFTLRHVH